MKDAFKAVIPTKHQENNVERFASRDLHYSTQHREIDGLGMTDIDSVEICVDCQRPIAFIELARDIGQNIFHKKATVTHYVADACRVPSYVLLYKFDETGEHISRVRLYMRQNGANTPELDWSIDHWFRYLKHAHAVHKQDKCFVKNS